MKSIFFYFFLCVCVLLVNGNAHAAPKSNPMTYTELYWACIKDGYSIYLAEENGKKDTDSLAATMSTLLIAAGVTNKSFTYEQMRAYLKKGHKIDRDKNLELDTEMLYPYLALGANLNYKAVDYFCEETIPSISKKNDIKGYDDVFEFSAFAAVLTAAKGARIAKGKKNHVSRWMSQYPIHFVAFVDKSGTYEVEIVYSKNKARTVKPWVQVYASEGLDKKSLAKAQQFTATIYSTAKNNWKNYHARTLGKFKLEAGKKYYIVFAATEKNRNKKKEIMALHMLRLKKQH